MQYDENIAERLQMHQGDQHEHQLRHAVASVEGIATSGVGTDEDVGGLHGARELVADVVHDLLHGHPNTLDQCFIPSEDRFLVHISATRTGPKKIQWYNFKKLVKTSGIATAFTTGTIYWLSQDVWIQMTGYAAIFILALPIAFAVNLEEDRDDSSMVIISICHSISRFSFLFGLFVSTTLTRWWSIRTDCIGKVSDHLITLSGLLASMGARILHADADWAVFQEDYHRIINYGLASMSFVAAESGMEFDDPVGMGYLTEKELALLTEISGESLAAAIWCWIGALASEMFEMCEVPAPNFNVLLQEVHLAVNGIHSLHHYLRTQLPFPYVHIITFLVNLHNAMMAINSAFRFTASWAEGNKLVQVFDVFHFFVVPMMYQSILLVSMHIMDPMGNDVIDFPIRLMQYETCSTCLEQKRCTRLLYEEMRATRRSPLPNSRTIWKLPAPPQRPQRHPESAAPAVAPWPRDAEGGLAGVRASGRASVPVPEKPAIPVQVPSDSFTEHFDRAFESAAAQLCDRVMLRVRPLVDAMEEADEGASDLDQAWEDPHLDSWRSYGIAVVG